MAEMKPFSESITEVYLERLMLAQCISVSPELMISGPKVAIWEDMVSRVVQVGFKGYLWGRTLEKHRFDEPLDWWEAFRERWLPAWWLKRWPIRRTTREISLTAYWPTIRYEVPDHLPRLVIAVNGRSEGTYPPVEPEH